MSWKSDLRGIMWVLFWIIIAIVIVALAINLIFGGYYAYHHSSGITLGPGYGMMSYFPAFWILGPILMIIPVIIFFLLIYWIIKMAIDEDEIAPYKEHDDAINVLNYRYAKGEITEEQYRKMKEEILKK